MTETDDRPVKSRGLFKSNSLRSYLILFSLYLSGLLTFLVIIADPFTMSTYFSDNSLLPGLANREFSLSTEAEYYLKDLQKLSGNPEEGSILFLSTSSKVLDFIKREFDLLGLHLYDQNFHFDQKVQYNGTNLYTIIRAERSTNSEAIALCIPYEISSSSNTLPSIALGIALTKYFASRNYWAKDVIVLFVDHRDFGTKAWLDSYYDVNLNSDPKYFKSAGENLLYESLQERSGPLQAAIVLDVSGREFSKLNVKIQGLNGQLPNLDLFNLVIELSARESITPYFQEKSLPFDLSTEELYKHHFETALSFMKAQATMKSDGLHGLFLKYAIQSLTLQAPEHKSTAGSRQIASTLLNLGRLVEGIFRSLNNLTERFNRSYYFYIILSLRRFTSIGYYMIPLGLMLTPIVLKALNLSLEMDDPSKISLRMITLLASSLLLSIISTTNISLAMGLTSLSVPILIFL